MLKLGHLFGISVGTGDPELITLKGLKLIQRSPVIAFPAGVRGKPGMAENIVTSYLTPAQTRLPLEFPYVQDLTILQAAWQKAAHQVLTYLEKGLDVAFVCEGDISFYSSFTYLAETIVQIYPEVVIQTVPGVAAPMAAVAALGIPLTIREQRLAILPALYSPADLEAALSWAEVIVLMKVSSVYEQVWQILAKYQLLERAMVVERASLPEQKIYRDLSHLPDLQLPYFSLLIVKNFKDDC